MRYIRWQYLILSVPWAIALGHALYHILLGVVLWAR